VSDDRKDRHGAGAYCAHIVFSQFCEIAVFALPWRPGPASAFGDHIGGVIGMSANKQMGGIAAQRVIAGVAHEQSMRDFPNV
jgi:hypothetical protein